jgi:hypothetical protein
MIKINFIRRMFIPLCFLAIVLGKSPPHAHAGVAEMAVFYDELVEYGEWVEYKHYGPVWFPTKVEEGWRPYLDGRWVPTAQGWVFETQEPWGWATYHFGNWIPTTEYGWVWVPGGTWYPSTVTWRASTKKGQEALGWAPVPPPEYEPEPAFAPPGGFPPETPVQERIVPAIFIYAPGSVFLRNIEEPYTPENSYMTCGEMVPAEQVEEYYTLSEVVNNFITEATNPELVADWGPPLDLVGT